MKVTCKGKGGLIGRAVTRVEDKAIDKLSDVFSAYPRFKAWKAGKQADSDVSVLKRARAYDKAPNEANGGDAGRTRFMAQEVRDRLLKKRGK